MDLYGQLMISLILIVVLSPFINWYIEREENKKFQNVEQWLWQHDLVEYTEIVKKSGYTTLPKLSTLSQDKIAALLREDSVLLSLQSAKIEHFYQHTQKLKLTLQFKYWLYGGRLKKLEKYFSSMNISTLKQVLDNREHLKDVKNLSKAGTAIGLLRYDDIDSYPVAEPNSIILYMIYILWVWTAAIAKFILVAFICGFVVAYVALVMLCIAIAKNITNGFGHIGRVCQQLFRGTNLNLQRNLTKVHTEEQNESKVGFFSSLFGNYFDATKTIVEWNIIDEATVVGLEVVLTLQFFKNNGLQFPAANLHNLKCEVLSEITLIESHINECQEENMMTVHFIPIKAGQYSISILANGRHAGNSPYKRIFKAAPIDAYKSSLHLPSSLLVLQQDVCELITFDERDKYGNMCLSKVEELYKYQFRIVEMKESGKKITPVLTFMVDNINENNKNKAWIKIAEAGVYVADVFYDDEILSDNIVLLVLTIEEMREVRKNVDATSWSLWYEAYIRPDPVTLSGTNVILPSDSSNTRKKLSVPHTPEVVKRKKVYCYITPKFLTIKEFYWKIFPKKLYTFRIKPSVKISLSEDTENGTDLKGFRFETNTDTVVDLLCQHRNVVVATFVKLLLKNIGGSECFEDKRSYFYRELYKLHTTKSQMRVAIKIKRQNIIRDTFRAVKSFSPGDWWKKVDISFEGELGLDYGGLTREWIHVLIGELFHADGALFQRFNKDDQQALIHPNPFRKEKYHKVKFFELAGQIVGKCLVECSCGQVRQQYVKARFTRSFLSQILGLGVNWRQFETDDKEYYTGKIKFILENDPQYLDLTFTEDVYDNEDKLVKTVELKHNGSKIEVTEANKTDYIQRLAEYRLSESVREEISSFLKGLNLIIPEGLLSIFDENELELLICGMDSISVADLKANFVQAGSGKSFVKVLDWFWTVISSFTQEELSRLLQFTTGCSQLPPNGFAGLVPRFQITSAGGSNTLPTAHTCFNNLCLPYYTSMEDMQEKLLLAITEGSEGFGMM